jgi:hypothetical protein
MQSNALKALLLELISPIHLVANSSLGSLSVEDWSALHLMARQHRLEPLLHWRLKHQHLNLAVPDAVRQALAEAFKRATLRSIMLQRELLQVHLTLQQAGIAHVALKGAYLAFFTYEHPALRPLRDLDILVPKAQALAAYQTLIDSGLQRIKGQEGDPTANLETMHQLPPLRRAGGRINVEIHAHLFHRDETEGFQHDPSEDPDFWSRCTSRVMAKQDIIFQSPTDLLLHLTVHAVYNHQFDNGPLLLTDLAALIDQHDIDWALFWRSAERGDHVRGCVLALKLMERYHGPKAIQWPDWVPKTSFDLPLDEAALMMLRDMQVRKEVELQSQFRAISPLNRLGLLVRKLFPSRLELAATYPVSPHSLAVYLWYPIKWWHLVLTRLPVHLQSYGRAELDAEVAQIGQIKRWLFAK